MLLTSSAFARELICTLTANGVSETQTVVIEDNAPVEVKFASRAGVTAAAKEEYDVVKVMMTVNGATFSSSDDRASGLKMTSKEGDSVSISCRIHEDPIGC